MTLFYSYPISIFTHYFSSFWFLLPFLSKTFVCLKIMFPLVYFLSLFHSYYFHLFFIFTSSSPHHPPPSLYIPLFPFLNTDNIYSRSFNTLTSSSSAKRCPKTNIHKRNAFCVIYDIFIMGQFGSHYKALLVVVICIPVQVYAWLHYLLYDFWLFHLQCHTMQKAGREKTRKYRIGLTHN